MAENISTDMSTADKQQETTENIRGRIIQNVRLIWLDPTIDLRNDHDNRAFINQLQAIFQTIDKFNEANQCIDFLTNIQNEKVFMILSNSPYQHIISCIHDLTQIDLIFIYHPEESINTDWIKTWSKIKGSFQQDTTLVKSLKQTARQYDENSISISIIEPNVDLIQNLDQLDPTFIYTQMLKEILLEMEYNKQSISDLSKCIGKFYPNNQQTLEDIGKFEQEYDKEFSIWWYTSKVFIYFILNQALRTLEVDTIIKMGVFIRDLHMNINEKYKKHETTDSLRKFTVYRGQGMSNKDFEKLQKSRGGLLSFNNFLSTSDDRDVSLMLATSNAENPNDPNVVGILFQMEIDGSFSSAPYADVGDVSQFEDEKETLFSMNTIFRIETIKPSEENNRLWYVNLTITSDTDQDLKALAEHLRNETKQTKGWSRLVPLLIRLGEFKKAKELCETLLQTTLKEHEKGSIYGQLGFIHDNLSDSRLAISWYEKALQIMSQLEMSNSESCASTYNNIGLAYKNLGEPKKALQFLEEGLEIYKKVLPSNHSYFGVINSNIGLMYDQLGNQSKALDFYEKANDFNNNLPKIHPELTVTYKNIVGIYKNQGDYSKALQFIKKALAIEEKSLPENHPSFAITYNHMGNIYQNLGDYSQAILFYEKAIEISIKKYGKIHQDLATGYGNISSVYIKTREYSKAVSKGEEAIRIGRIIYKEDHVQLAIFYNTVGLAYCHLNQHEKAVWYCEKSLDIYEKTSDTNSLDLANGCISLGGIYMIKGEHERALKLFEKGRDIQEKNLPEDHPDLANTYTNMGQVYCAMREHDRALFFSNRGLIIRQKKLPKYHPELITSYASIGAPLVAMRKRSEAIAAWKHAVDIAQHALSTDDEQRIMCEYMYELLRK